jgi:hypothetical protein
MRNVAAAVPWGGGVHGRAAHPQGEHGQEAAQGDAPAVQGSDLSPKVRERSQRGRYLPMHILGSSSIVLDANLWRFCTQYSQC